MDELIDFAAIAAHVDGACLRPDRTPYATEVMVRLVFIRSLYNLSDEDREYQASAWWRINSACQPRPAMAPTLHSPPSQPQDR